MISPEYVRLMAAYTRWQNRSIYSAAASLDDRERRRDRGGFFGSIHATLNHVLWGDQTWMHRLAGTPAPAAGTIPDSVAQFETWESLCDARQAMDAAIADWAERVTANDLDGELGWYSGALGRDVRRPRWTLVVQLFNHGTHHRGQVHAMLTAAGALPEDTDVQFMPDVSYAWPS